MNVPAGKVRRQIETLFAAWGMDPGLARTAADVMVETDLAGVDSHGVSMLMDYDDYRRRGKLNRAGSAGPAWWWGRPQRASTSCSSLRSNPPARASSEEPSAAHASDAPRKMTDVATRRRTVTMSSQAGAIGSAKPEGCPVRPC